MFLTCVRVYTQWIFVHRPSVYHVYHIIVGDISLKTRCFGLHFCRRKFRLGISSTTLCSAPRKLPNSVK